MGAGKTTVVELKCEPLGLRRQRFELGHAERLLSMERNGGWEIDDERFEYVEGYGIGRKGHKTGVRQPE